jgi:cysteine dioxygenase
MSLPESFDLNKENINESSLGYPKSLQELREQIHLLTKNEYVDIQDLCTLMENYKCDLNEVQRYINFQPNIYTRNLIDGGNGKFNFILLCWNTKSGSPIHDHTSSHCIMNSQPSNAENGNQSMNIIAEQQLHAGEVSYMHDRIGLHRVGNPSETEGSMSLHLYMPPFDHCKIFKQETGEENTVPIKFHTIDGKIPSPQ